MLQMHWCVLAAIVAVVLCHAKCDPTKYFCHATVLVNNGSVLQRCGGSLIAENVVLTAAHCLKNVDFETSVIVRLSSEHWERPLEFHVTEYAIHPRYNCYTHAYDVAVLILKVSLNLWTSKLKKQVVTLRSGEMDDGQVLQAITMGPKLYPPEKLQTVNLTIIDSNYGWEEEQPHDAPVTIACAISSPESCQRIEGEALTYQNHQIGVIAKSSVFPESIYLCVVVYNRVDFVKDFIGDLTDQSIWL